MSAGGIVAVPRVPSGMIDRADLRARLGRAPLTVIRAPGGSGKTVLMAQWAAAHSGAGVWITVESDIGGRVVFWRTVVESLARFGVGQLAGLEESTSPEGIRGAVLRAFRTLESDVVLVIDDAHDLQDDAVLDDLVAVVRASSRLTVLVGTRSPSVLEAPGLTLTLDVDVVPAEQLALTVDDVLRIVGDGASGATAEELLSASGGNLLLLRAVLAGSATRVDPRASAQTVIADYLRTVFLRDADLEQFATTSSVADEVDALLAAELSGLPPATVDALLDALEADGLVMRRSAAGATRFRYHPLVREVLRDELRRKHPDRFRSVSLIASAEAEVRREYLAALRHAVDAEDYARASDVCLHGGFALLRSRGASSILRRVPMRYVAGLPFLAVILGLAANGRGERLRALELLTLALGASRTRRRSQRVAEQAGLALIEASVLRITGRAEDAVAPAQRMMRLLETSPLTDLEEISDQLGSYWYQGALCLFRAGRLAAARVAAERVGISADALASGGPESIGAASLAAVIDAALGECRSASELLDRIDASGQSPQELDGYLGSLAHLARAIVLLDAGDARGSRRQLELFGDRPNLEHGPLFNVLRAIVSLWEGDPDLGLRALDRREATDRPRARMSGQDRHVAGAVRALLHTALDQPAQARAALRALDRRDPLSVLLHAQFAILEQRPDAALERLTEQHDWRGPRLQSAADLLTACASLMRGDDDLALIALRRFLAIDAVHGTRWATVLVPIELRSEFAALAERAGADGWMRDAVIGAPALFRLGHARAALTPREVQVLHQLRSTSSTAEIARDLSVSTNTVKSQVRTLYRKLGVSSRDEALRAAYLQGLLERR